MKIPLIILLGFPGAGKTTLARAFIKKHPEYKFMRVFDDYMKGKHIGPKGEILTKNYVIKAHDALYADVTKTKVPTIIELGTNYPRYNCKKLKKLLRTDCFDLKIVFCLLDQDICLERFTQGLKKGQRLIMQKPLLVERMKRNFPKIYQIQCQNFNFPFFEFKMKMPVEKNVKKLEKILRL